jgi:hypothetical protein
MFVWLILMQNWRLQPRMEALVRLRYARILFEETDNNLEAETALSKGVCTGYLSLILKLTIP